MHHAACCSYIVHSTVSASLPPSFTPSLPPCPPPFSRGRYRRTRTSLPRYKVSFHLLTRGTGFPCIQHRGKRTHWEWIAPDYLWGGCSFPVFYGEGHEAVGGFYQDLIWQLLRLSFPEKKVWYKSAVAIFIYLLVSSPPLNTSHTTWLLGGKNISCWLWFWLHIFKHWQTQTMKWEAIMKAILTFCNISTVSYRWHKPRRSKVKHFISIKEIILHTFFTERWGD